MKTVPLHGEKAAGRVALVDDADYDLVMQYRWCAKDEPSGLVTYAVANIKPDGRHTTVMMHKLLTGWRLTDHADRDGLNNQRYNLRPATNSQNGANKVGMPWAASQYKGISWWQGAWVASIKVGDHRVYLGRFPDDVSAARAYDTAARAAWGEYARVNFPDLSDYVPPPRFCTECGTDIPDAAHANIRYCSYACRRKANTRAWTESRRRARAAARDERPVVPQSPSGVVR